MRAAPLTNISGSQAAPHPSPHTRGVTGAEMSDPARPPIEPASPCRSHEQRTRARLERRAQRTALQLEKAEVVLQRDTQRHMMQRRRQQHPSAMVRQLRDLRAEMDALAARLDALIAPSAAKARRKRMRKNDVTQPSPQTKCAAPGKPEAAHAASSKAGLRATGPWRKHQPR